LVWFGFGFGFFFFFLSAGFNVFSLSHILHKSSNL
jgi:hypothetical protein